jgi:GTPase
VKDFVKRFKFKGPVFEISALTHEGCDRLVKSVFEHVKAKQVAETTPEVIDPRFQDPSSN